MTNHVASGPPHVPHQGQGAAAEAPPLPNLGPPGAPNPAPLPPDWWRCHRLGPVSGRYEGEMTTPQAGRFFLELRVDIDPRSQVSPVLNRVSGDIWQVFRFGLPGRPPIVWRTYRSSWIVEQPQVAWSRCSVDINGPVTFWGSVLQTTTAQIRIPWNTFTPAGPATVSLVELGGATSTYQCARVSDSFRDVGMEIDVCASVNQAPLLPSYDTTWHNQRPPGLPQRTLTIETAYDEAGIHVVVDPNHTVIDDSASGFQSWSPAELHDAMETHYTQFAGTWPRWHMWGLLAGVFDNANVGGIMFDAAAAFGGAGEAPERQGFAVFRRHSWFNNLVEGTPQNQDQAWAMRHFLYTWVHEAGHAYNFLHSWDKARPDSLSWMNYDWRYDQRNGAGSFWTNFRFRFDDDELLHLRHGNRAAVIMGGDPWSSGGHLEGPVEAMAQVEGEPALELLMRSNAYFDLMEPVIVELRLRNLLDLPIEIDQRLAPEFGGVLVYVRKPDGRVVQYAPVLCALGTPEMLTLQPGGKAKEGADRYSREIFLSFGKDGFYFDHPGEYLLRAIYQGPGDILVPSNVHRIRIGTPTTREEDRLAQGYFAKSVGLVLYLQGSRSPHLARGMSVLEDIASRYKDELLGAKIGMALAQGLAKPFYRLPDDGPPKLVRAATAEPKRALALTDPALKLLRKDTSRQLNLAYGRVVRRRVDYHKAAGTKERAKQELTTLGKDLASRGANANVLAMYKSMADSL